MQLQKWIQKNQTGIIIGALVALVIPLDMNLALKLGLGALAGGYINSLQTPGKTKKNFGFALLILPVIGIIAGGLFLTSSILDFTKPQAPTLLEQLQEIPIWIWIVGGFFTLWIVKKLTRRKQQIFVIPKR